MDTLTNTLKKDTIIPSYVFYALAFGIPIFFNAPQLITGSVINCLLFLASNRLSKFAFIPLMLLPSLGTMIHGIMFGPQTVFLYYFLPFIWIGNIVLVSISIRLSSYPNAIRIFASSAGKFLFLQLFALWYVQLHIVPPLFAASMGYIQLATAVLGGILAFGIDKILSYE
jgi:hypothetical protein